MRMTRHIRAAILLVATAVLSAGCSEATGPDDDVPVGLQIHLNGALVIRVDGSSIDGVLHVHVGEYSGQFIVSATNGAGNVIEQPFRLEASVDNPDIARFVQATDGDMEGEIVASITGDTRLHLQLFVIGPGGTDPAFTAPPIDIFAVSCASPDLVRTAPATADSPAGCARP